MSPVDGLRRRCLVSSLPAVHFYASWRICLSEARVGEGSGRCGCSPADRRGPADAGCVGGGGRRLTLATPAWYSNRTSLSLSAGLAARKLLVVVGGAAGRAVRPPWSSPAPSVSAPAGRGFCAAGLVPSAALRAPGSPAPSAAQPTTSSVVPSAASPAASSRTQVADHRFTSTRPQVTAAAAAGLAAAALMTTSAACGAFNCWLCSRQGRHLATSSAATPAAGSVVAVDRSTGRELSGPVDYVIMRRLRRRAACSVVAPAAGSAAPLTAASTAGRGCSGAVGVVAGRGVCDAGLVPSAAP